MSFSNSNQFKKAFDAISIFLASPKQIRDRSFGEVTKPETINYRTLKPEKDGLFCARIFGPIKDYQCSCGKYKRFRYKGIVCEKCKVEVISSKVRRSRMGHIELVSPVAHIWFAKSVPNKLSLTLDISTKKLDSVLYFEKYIVIDPGTTAFEKNQLMTPEEYENSMRDCSEAGDIFEANIGPEAVKRMLANVDLESEINILKKKMKSEVCTDIIKRKYIKRYKLLSGFFKSGNKPEWMIIDALPVLPPDLRPLVPLEGGRFAVSDLNDLYRRVINRNNRLKKLMELNAPNIILHNEMRMLQESVFSLFDNSRKDRPVMGMNKRPLKSLSEAFRGKASRFRQHLLGKRVDYSARSVICVGPELKLHQCGVPRLIAIELFRPFIFAGLQKDGYAQSLHTAKKMVESGSQYAYDVLEKVVKDHCVLLNRAPTLHRQSIQAFEPVLINGKAIQLHPLVCEIFNADFDGDQMAIHLPLSVEAQAEARTLMLSSLNIRNPSNGDCTIIPKEDILVGLYYLTYAIAEKFESDVFCSEDEAVAAYHAGIVKLQTQIKCFVQTPSGKRKLYDTTPGRCLIYKQIGSYELDFSYFNIVLSSSTLKEFFSSASDVVADATIVLIADTFKDLGFEYSTKSGVSFGKDDMIVPEEKAEIMASAEKQVEQYRQQYKNGLLSDSERYHKVINIWSTSIETLLEKLVTQISSVENGFYNDMYLIQVSGARGSKEQMRQLCAARGIMYDASGNILEIPIKSSFKEGLSVTEYFFSTAGGRKSLADTAIKTADAGYLTRRLVDVVEDVCIICNDCGTTKSIQKKYIRDGESVILSLEDAVYGRFAAQDIIINSELICLQNDYIDKKIAKKVGESRLESVKVRSALTCDLSDGNLCVKCYGLDLSKSRLVNLNESVGIIAAHSISEPSTQLTMRSFHTGGTAKTSLDDSTITVDKDCSVNLINCRFFENNNKKIVVSYSAECCLIDSETKVEIARYKIPYGSELFIDQNCKIKTGTVIASWDAYINPIISESTGKVIFKDLIPKISLEEIFDELTGISIISVSNWKQNVKGDKLKPRIVIKSETDEVEYNLSPYTVILISEGSNITPGTILAKEPKSIESSKDITGGLTRVSDLFEMKKQKNTAVMVKNDGVVKFVSETKNSMLIKVVQANDKFDEYSVSKNKSIIVYNGSHVKKGDLLTTGEQAIQDILNILGLEAVASHLMFEIQAIYRAQGINVNDKHFEVVIRQMLSSVKIKDSGSSKYLTDDVVDYFEFMNKVKEFKDKNQTPPKAERIIEGITKVSLENKSFISAAAFRDATRILTSAAINGLTDNLTTKKSAAIVGLLMNAGTGKFARDIIRMNKKM